MKYIMAFRPTQQVILGTILLLFLIPASGTLWAKDEKKPVTDIEAFSLEELLNVQVISASKISQKMSEAPSVISLITEEQIRSYGWQSINDILFTQPGFFPSQDYDRITVGSRGLFEGWNNNHLLLLIDGVPMNDNLYGSAYTSEITPLCFIKSIEIIRGPGSALYGSNATNGVISINTLSSQQLQKKTLAQFRLGDNNTQIVDWVGGGDTDYFNYLLAINVVRTNGNGYDSYDGSFRTDENGALKKFKTRDDRTSTYLLEKSRGKIP